ncbi:diacylglycerol kinase family protein [Vitiosangium sp. GDMCC 1.1324]|uniref:diacylglycerol/lipid kinase family protein n=1 Tax=Vitiosangium sp. (strain GDMCC 1.1324) TaxID=2138576 RepID=UPI000D36D75B|nr:diacylglycerol kinase family protein [Vitiosangium sp. GDMCC 1.1324]PTL76099.1 transcriptional regulator [Vitiosangium sp. GDMCC 1.1324]
MKTFLVVNPRSAGGQTGKRWAEISGQVTRAIGDFGFGFTESAMDAVRLTRQALHDGYECIAAVGGDGTINEVVNGFFADGKAINPNAALGLIPRGTGGDFRRAFGWDLELDSALERLRTDKTEPFDVGLAEYVNFEGQKESRYFANIASFGVSAAVAHEVNTGSKVLGGRVSFAWGTVKTMAKYRDRRVRLRVDGGEPEELDITVVAASNGRYFGGGMCVAPKALTHDGLFELTIWHDYGVADFVIKSKGVYNGDHITWDKTRYFQCRTLEAESDQEVFLEMDGEVPGRLPCRISILPGAIRLKV